LPRRGWFCSGLSLHRITDLQFTYDVEDTNSASVRCISPSADMLLCTVGVN
jgi:hypothetical protein